MKKTLTITTVILGSLYGIAEAAPITSPIYMPSNGEILTNVEVGYYKTDSTKKGKPEINKGWQANLYGKIGVNDYIAINYDFDYHFFRKTIEMGSGKLAKKGAEFDNFSFGVTGRVLNEGSNKFDVIFNVGETTNLPGNLQFTTAELAVRYGLDLDNYNLGLSGGIRYYNDYRDGDKKIEHDLDYRLALENEFILGNKFTIGFDIFYDRIGKTKKDFEFKSYSEYGAIIDGNFAINSSNYIGAYVGYSKIDLKDVKPDNINYGLKYTAQF